MPPETVTVAVPSPPLLQETSVDEIVEVSIAGSSTVIESVSAHPLLSLVTAV